MSPPPSVVVLGGGLSGMAAAYALAHAGAHRVTLVERGSVLGGLAGTFSHEGRFYPLAYHHILHRDRTLLYFLDRIGALRRVRWRRIHMLFRQRDRLFNLARPGDFLRFPMSLPDKARFVRLMLRCFRKSDWSDWHDRSAADLVDAWAGPGVRRALFEPLTRLKFDLPCAEVSGAWLGARLHFREGSAPLGFIPGTNWTQVLCEGLTEELRRSGVRVLLKAGVTALAADGRRVGRIVLADGEQLTADLVVSTVPTEVYRELIPVDDTPQLSAIRYTAIVSAVLATRQSVAPDFYWMNLPTLDLRSCGLFRLESLNPTIGAPGETCLNFVTHLPSRQHPVFGRSTDRLLADYREDFRAIFGFELKPFWSHLARLPMYSPVFARGYRNPPARSTSWDNVYFAGNYRTFPSIASTGTALRSGLEAAAAILDGQGRRCDLHRQAVAFRLRAMPHG